MLRGAGGWSRSVPHTASPGCCPGGRLPLRTSGCVRCASLRPIPPATAPGLQGDVPSQRRITTAHGNSQAQAGHTCALREGVCKTAGSHIVFKEARCRKRPGRVPRGAGPRQRALTAPPRQKAYTLGFRSSRCPGLSLSGCHPVTEERALTPVAGLDDAGWGAPECWRVTRAPATPSQQRPGDPRESAAHLQVPDVEGLLEDVGGVGAGRQRPHVGQVAAEAAHGLDDEHAALGPARRLLDAVARLHRGAPSGGAGRGHAARP